METQDTKQVKIIAEKILISKKYKTLDPALVSIISSWALVKFGWKRAIDEARNKLHQIWGAYTAGGTNYQRLLDTLKDSLQSLPEKEVIRPILNKHSSTRERLPVLNVFYEEIFAITGIPEHIVDLGCGLNPLTLPWMNLPPNVKYSAFDIDSAEVQFLNSTLTLLGYKNAHARLAHSLTAGLPSADVVLLLKLLPVLEQLETGLSLKVLKSLQAKWLVVSFPTKSIGGNEKGMSNSYRDWLTRLITPFQWKVSELSFETERVFIVDTLTREPRSK